MACLTSVHGLEGARAPAPFSSRGRRCPRARASQDWLDSNVELHRRRRSGGKPRVQAADRPRRLEGDQLDLPPSAAGQGPRQPREEGTRRERDTEQALFSIPWIVPLALLAAPLLLSSPLLLLTLAALVAFVPRLREVLLPALQGLWQALQTLAHTPLAEHEHTQGQAPQEPTTPGPRGTEDSPSWLVPRDKDFYR